MRMYAFAAMTLLIIAAISIMDATAISATDKGISAGENSDPLLKTMQSNIKGNETVEGQLEMGIWNSFIENFDYESEILNGTRLGNMTNEEAMIATTAILTLNSYALAESENVTPSELYKDFHNYSINAMKYYNVYLYNMAKLLETKDAKYAQNARDAFDQSMDYYSKGKSEAEFLY